MIGKTWVRDDVTNAVLLATSEGSPQTESGKYNSYLKLYRT